MNRLLKAVVFANLNDVLIARDENKLVAKGWYLFPERRVAADHLRRAQKMGTFRLFAEHPPIHEFGSGLLSVTSSICHQAKGQADFLPRLWHHKWFDQPLSCLAGTWDDSPSTVQYTINIGQDGWQFVPNHCHF